MYRCKDVRTVDGGCSVSLSKPQRERGKEKNILYEFTKVVQSRAIKLNTLDFRHFF